MKYHAQNVKIKLHVYMVLLMDYRVKCALKEKVLLCRVNYLNKINWYTKNRHSDNKEDCGEH